MNGFLIMHKNNKISEYLYNITNSHHIDHHCQTYLNQKVDDKSEQKAFIFELFSPLMIFVIFLIMSIFYGI